MTPQAFSTITALVKEQSGIKLTDDKVYLVESRLRPLLRRRGMDSLDDLAVHLASRRDEPLIREVTEAMTTNESFFFRDIKPFEIFRETVLKTVIESRGARRSFRIWSAACSSGQEPYSLAMILSDEAARLKDWRVDIVATDIATEMLAKAKSGRYSQFEVQRGLPMRQLVKYFRQDGSEWEINPQQRAMVDFRVQNILHECRSLGTFDVIFCRNVLLYFDPETKRQVISRISRQLAPDGFLFLGGTESLMGLSQEFEPLNGNLSIYRRIA
jgi:chemotaxis protein methyltransferase CheR